MKYEDIVNMIKESVQAHLIIEDFGYGNISDIKVKSEESTPDEADYPYVFLNPTIHGRSTTTMIYRFNMIVMDMVANDNYLKIQSECQQYIDDIIARIKLYYRLEVNLALVEYTPFKERFIDEVAGVTCALEIIIPSKLDSSSAPFDPNFVSKFPESMLNKTC